MVKVDFSQVPEYVPVGAGRYLTTVTQSYLGISKSGGKRTWYTEFQVDEDPVYEGASVGKKIRWQNSLQSNALWKFQQSLAALGSPTSVEDTDFDFEPEDYIGRQCGLAVQEEKDPIYGRQSRVTYLFHKDEWESDEMDEEDED